MTLSCFFEQHILCFIKFTVNVDQQFFQGIIFTFQILPCKGVYSILHGIAARSKTGEHWENIPEMNQCTYCLTGAELSTTSTFTLLFMASALIDRPKVVRTGSIHCSALKTQNARQTDIHRRRCIWIETGNYCISRRIIKIYHDMPIEYNVKLPFNGILSTHKIKLPV